MFDPYAAVLASVKLAEGVNVVPPKKDSGVPSNPPATMGCLVSLVEDFDFGSSQRCVVLPQPQILVSIPSARISDRSSVRNVLALTAGLTPLWRAH